MHIHVDSKLQYIVVAKTGNYKRILDSIKIMHNRHSYIYM